MPDHVARTPRASAPPARPPLLTPTPPMAPLMPPVHAVDLMTEAGSAVFGAVWRGIEAKIIEIPALTDSMPEFKTTYDIDPHAEELGFDDSGLAGHPGHRAWRPSAAAAGVILLVSRTRLTIPANALGFATAGAFAVLKVNVDDYAEIWVDGEMPRAAGRPSPAHPGLQHAPPPGARRPMSGPATRSRSPCSRSTGRSRQHRSISSGSARRRSNSSAEPALRSAGGVRRGRRQCCRGAWRRRGLGEIVLAEAVEARAAAEDLAADLAV